MVRDPARVRRFGLALGVLYVLLGIMETVRLLVTGDGGFFFWFGTLVGGGTLILLGSLPQSPPHGRRLAAVCVGAAVGLPATAWTVVVPLLAAAVVVLTVMSQREVEPSLPGSS